MIPKNVLITGGSGFIGSAVIRHLIQKTNSIVVNLDKLTYASNVASLASVENDSRYSFKLCDIGDKSLVSEILDQFKPDIIIHLAAESHVDRSIDGPAQFIETNIVGTFRLLEATHEFWYKLPKKKKDQFKFHHVSTDEVFGDLGASGKYFTENTPYNPSSPYSASKASSDHLVRSWNRTYGIPVVLTNCSNNYGPFQFPEKLIPHMILNAIQGKALPVYGNGGQVRDWLFVEDHADALVRVAFEADAPCTYNIGGQNEKTNLEVVNQICELLEELHPEKPKNIDKYKDLICFVKDRPGHDQRYAIDASKITNALGWTPENSFDIGLRKTVEWYLQNINWWQNVLNGSYKLNRLGLDGKLKV